MVATIGIVSKDLKTRALNATDEKLTSLFERKEYGFKLPLRPGLAIYVFAPKSSSADGMKPSELNANGLRGHEGTFTERVTFLRFADNLGDDGSKPLSYIFHNKNEKSLVMQSEFGVGSTFFSVEGELGFWHVLRNTSNRPIMLMIAVDKLEGLRRT
jgi:hypothetical protein